jgi:hypothetical protein
MNGGATLYLAELFILSLQTFVESLLSTETDGNVTVY